jgi:hypothetical protein
MGMKIPQICPISECNPAGSVMIGKTHDLKAAEVQAAGNFSPFTGRERRDHWPLSAFG